jgi:hypothetical protein
MALAPLSVGTAVGTTGPAKVLQHVTVPPEISAQVEPSPAATAVALATPSTVAGTREGCVGPGAR